MLIFKGETRENAECTVTLAKGQLMGLTFGKKEVIESLAVEGNPEAVIRLIKYMTPFYPMSFNIVEP